MTDPARRGGRDAAVHRRGVEGGGAARGSCADGPLGARVGGSAGRAARGRDAPRRARRRAGRVGLSCGGGRGGCGAHFHGAAVLRLHGLAAKASRGPLAPCASSAGGGFGLRGRWRFRRARPPAPSVSRSRWRFRSSRPPAPLIHRFRARRCLWPSRPSTSASAPVGAFGLRCHRILPSAGVARRNFAATVTDWRIFSHILP